MRHAISLAAVLFLGPAVRAQAVKKEFVFEKK